MDTAGRIADGWPPFYEPGWMVAEHQLPRENEFTIYTRFGDWFPILCGLIWLVIVTVDLILNLKQRRLPETW